MTITSTEADAIEYLRSRQDKLVDFLAALVQADSQNPPGGEAAVAQLVVDHLVQLGIRAVAVVESDEARSNVLATCATSVETGRSHLLLCGHLDTKPAGDRAKWSSEPLRPVIRNGRMYGLGTCDMKGAVAAMVYTAGAVLNTLGAEAAGLGLALVADEERGGDYGIKYLVRQGLITADAAIVGEPAGITEDWEYLYSSSRGEACFTVRVAGTQTHSSIADRIPSRNAIARAAELLVAMNSDGLFAEESAKVSPERITFVPGMLIQGGVTYGVLPGECRFGCEVRIPPGVERTLVADAIDRFIAKEREKDPSLDVEWDFEPLPLGWIAPTDVGGEHTLVQTVRGVAKDVLGRELPLGSFPAWTDARILQESGVLALPAFGPGRLCEAHSPNESVDLSSVEQAAEMYTLSAVRYLVSRAHQL